ncbi:MAG: dihydropteroate synthase [Deltaproteobacteria bacterium]|nr:dihydropteroate synthase [Deltaproteobacteria bacterium]
MRYLQIASAIEAREELQRIGVAPYGAESMAPKMESLNLFLEGIECKVANIMKQEMLSIGGDVAVARGVVGCTVEKTDAIIMGSLKQIEKFADKLSPQPFNLSKVAEDIRKIVSNLNRSTFILKTPVREIHIGERTLIMGIVNVTPDSFSDGGILRNLKDAVQYALNLVQMGADIIDIGGESSRPGSDPVMLKEELRRVIPLVKELKNTIGVPISVDTMKADVAREALESGAEIINDISAMRNDQNMAEVAAHYGVPVILMHMRGVPKTMQAGDISYLSVMEEVTRFLDERIEAAESAGIDRDNIIIDPGIGFGKRAIDNNVIIRRLKELKSLGRPILVGTSRKAFIGSVTGKPAADRLDGTAATVTAAIMNGANIVRVHDVGFFKGVSRMTDAIVRSEP